MPKLIQNITANILDNFIGTVILFKSIEAQAQQTDYINLNGFIAFLQTYTSASTITEFPVQFRFGLFNTYNVPLVVLNISGDTLTIHQEPIYIQNDSSASVVRNKEISIVNMSSDICTFKAPQFFVSGATKIDCSSGNTGTTGIYIISTATTIPLTFDFTGNTDTFTANNTTFSFEIYKNNPNTNIFLVPPVFTSGPIPYSGFSGTNITTQNIPISGLSLDGDYLIKGYFVFDACTSYLNLLGKTVNTLIYRSGTEFGLYNPNSDYYFVAFSQASKPIFALNGSNTPPADGLFQQVILPGSGQTTVLITNQYEGTFLVTLNGLVLANGLDYTFSGNLITLSSATVYDDIITVIYTTTGGNNLDADVINITTPIVSGTTNNQGSNTTYFDTTTGKYELFTSVMPAQGGSILVMINGVTLANGIDYYQSISDSKRIILTGNLLVGDVIILVYFPTTSVVNGLSTNIPLVSWSIQTEPESPNGVFILQVSTGNTFSNFYSTGSTPYIVGQTNYSLSFVASGSVGTILYYRVENIKNYVTICGKIIQSITYSDIIPITIQTNAINSY